VACLIRLVIGLECANTLFDACRGTLATYVQQMSLDLEAEPARGDITSATTCAPNPLLLSTYLASIGDTGPIPKVLMALAADAGQTLSLPQDPLYIAGRALVYLVRDGSDPVCPYDCTVTVSESPACSCVDFVRHRSCRHVNFVLMTCLRVPADSEFFRTAPDTRGASFPSRFTSDDIKHLNSIAKETHSSTCKGSGAMDDTAPAPRQKSVPPKFASPAEHRANQRTFWQTMFFDMPDELAKIDQELCSTSGEHDELSMDQDTSSVQSTSGHLASSGYVCDRVVGDVSCYARSSGPGGGGYLRF